MKHHNDEENIKVMVRLKPITNTEYTEASYITTDNNSITINTKGDTKSFLFDHVFIDTATQEQVFERAGQPLADAYIKGYNTTIFAYGQTGAGKTYTIEGEQGELVFKFRGLIPRITEYIRCLLEKAKETYTLKCSYLEIYKEVIIDLLNPQAENLHLREDTKKGVHVENLMEVSCEDVEEVLKIGKSNKHIESTTTNQESSRSHTVFTLILETKKETIKRFHIVDLAGSERPKLTEHTGERLKETGGINKSLSSLGNVINSLVEISQGKVRHVAYRDSKLTFLLKDSLGGNSKTVIIANVSQNSLHAGETLSTLSFAKRAKMIKTKILVNKSAELKSLLKNSLELKANDMTILIEHIKGREEELEILKKCVRRCQNDKARDKMILMLKEAALVKLQQGKLTSDDDRERLRREVQVLRDTEEETFKNITEFISHSDTKEQLVKSNMEKSEHIDQLSKCIKKLSDERDTLKNLLNANTAENNKK